nr:hypothetical protein [Tanacetum cinerariifolium]
MGIAYVFTLCLRTLLSWEFFAHEDNSEYILVYTAALAAYFFLRRCLKANKRAKVYYECMESFKSLMRLWVRSKSIAAIWMEKAVTPFIVPAIEGFTSASAVLKPERLKVDKTRVVECERRSPQQPPRAIKCYAIVEAIDFDTRFASFVLGDNSILSLMPPISSLPPLLVCGVGCRLVALLSLCGCFFCHCSDLWGFARGNNVAF